MFKRLLWLNVLLAAIALVLFFQLVRVLSTSRPLPPPAGSPPVQAVVPPREEPTRARPPLAAYGLVATKNLFNPSRSETVAQVSLTPGARPLLHGVVIDGKTRLAYLEDPSTKRVAGYRPGDPVAGGTLERIESDRVVITRPEGPLEILLVDPAKPKPVVTAPTPTPRVLPPPATPSGVPPIPSVVPAPPGMQSPPPSADPRLLPLLRRQQGAPQAPGAPGPSP